MADIQEKIIHATWRLINNYGVQNLKVNDIAREAGISKRTLYRYFSSKDELLAFIFKQKQENMINKLDNIINGQGRELDKYEKFLDFIKNMVAEQNYKFLDNLRRENPEVYQRIIHEQKQFQSKIMKLLVRGIDKGEVNPSLNPVIISYLVIKLANSIIEPEFFMKNSISIDQVFDNLKELLINGLRKRDEIKTD